MNPPTDQTHSAYCYSLPVNTCLNGKYVIQNVLGKGGFGITYKGYQKDTGNHVAIKEYFPNRIALRTQTESAFLVSPYPDTCCDEFDDGREHFLKEAKILKELKPLDSIVSVYDYFEENGTAYIVMEYIKGLTLRQFITENGTLSFPELLVLITPVILSLSEIHKKGLIHRDISPDNLILDTESRLHLIDFGAAKQNTSQNDTNTIILKAGYAPAESYIPNGKIGPWTDVYSLCATIYFALTGKTPLEAVQRLDSDEEMPLGGLDNLLPWQRAAIEQGLQIRPANRFANMQKLYGALTTPVPLGGQETVRGVALSMEMRKLHRNHKKKYLLLIPILVGTILLILVFSRAFNAKPDTTVSPNKSYTTPATKKPSGAKIDF